MIRSPANVNMRRVQTGFVAVAVLFACAFGFWSAGRDGLSKLLSEYGSATGSLAATSRALHFGSQDAGAHYAQAAIFGAAGEGEHSLNEFQQAAALRPADYFLWLQLGREYDATGNDEGAQSAFQKAISLAPGYAEPRWQLGNLLLRRGEEIEAFTELRRAATSDPQMFPALVDLAWGFYQGNPDQVLRAAQPGTDLARISLASFFINHGKPEESVDLLRGVITAKGDRHRLVSELIERHKFQQARTVWLMDSGPDEPRSSGVFDGSFETPIEVNETGFGWRLSRARTVDFTVDEHTPNSGTRSLNVSFHGEFDPAVAIASQLLLVDPHSRYRLSFVARTSELVSAGLPVIAVREWGEEGRVLAESNPLPHATTGWQSFAITFDAGEGVGAIALNIQRQRCVSFPCPIFGRAWFDSFVLEKL